MTFYSWNLTSCFSDTGEQRVKSSQNNPGEEPGEAMVFLPDTKACY